jgi:hypothetical protein
MPRAGTAVMKRTIAVLITLAMLCVSAEAGGGLRIPLIPKMPGYKTIVITEKDGILEKVFAGKIISRSGAVEVGDIKDAKYILAVVRSPSLTPLKRSYENFEVFDDAVQATCKANCPKGHIYVFSIQPDRSLKVVYHNVFDWATNTHL